MKSTALAFAAFALSCSPAMAQDAAQCAPLRWTTLGTAGGPVPTFERSEPANLLEAGSHAILVDSGDGTVGQLARIGRQVGDVDTVFLSHLHIDHTAGLAAVLGLRWMNEFPGVITVYGPPGTAEVVDGIIASMAPPSKIGFGIGAKTPQPRDGIRVVEMGDGDTAQLDGLTVTAAANSHFDPPPGVEQDLATVSLSFRFDFGGRSITYTGDTGPSDAVTALASGSDMLVSEVIALNPLLEEIAMRRKDAPPQLLAHMHEHLSTHHVDPVEIGRMARAGGVGRVVLTHYAISGPLRANEAYLRDGVRRHFGGPLDLSRDLSSFDLGCQ